MRATRSSLAQACRAIADFLGDTVAEECRDGELAAQLLPYVQQVAEAAWDQGFQYGREHYAEPPLCRANPYKT